MSTSLQRTPGFGAAKLRTEAAKPQPASLLPDARKAPAVRAAVLRPIDLERRARFARMETDAPRGA